MNPIIKKIVRVFLKITPFIPDSFVIRAEYYHKLHRFPNLQSPKRFTEWLQWYKINYRNESMFDCVDKLKVRRFVESHGCGQYLNTLYQVCNDANDIDYDSLPDKFVIKTTDGGNGENVFVCHDKTKINIREVNEKVNSWRNSKLGLTGREWAYNGCIESKIIVEKFLEDPDSYDGSIDDYKLLCFNGKFRYLWVDKNRYSNHRRGFWNEKLEFLPDVKSDHPTFEIAPQLPANTRDMVEMAEKLAADFPFARVDFYNIRGKIIFGEITFYPWSGYVKYTPDSFDFELGNYCTINIK